jgi:hypothetical protein
MPLCKKIDLMESFNNHTIYLKHDNINIGKLTNTKFIKFNVNSQPNTWLVASKKFTLPKQKNFFYSMYF